MRICRSARAEVSPNAGYVRVAGGGLRAGACTDRYGRRTGWRITSSCLARVSIHCVSPLRRVDQFEDHEPESHGLLAYFELVRHLGNDIIEPSHVVLLKASSKPRSHEVGGHK